MQTVEPIHVLELFPPLGRELLAVLRALGPEQWKLPTACAPWTVKDVAAHLLGGSLGRLWERGGEGDGVELPVMEYHELLRLIDRSNAEWVQAARRISPQMLIEFLELTDCRLYTHFKSLDPAAPARITVAWAGDDLPPNWFDIAREYTEKWLHQEHIRAAAGKPLLTGRKWLAPVLDTFMRALPRTFRQIAAADGTRMEIQITGEAGGEWTLVRIGAGWELLVGRNPQPACRVQIDQDLAWRLFTRGVSPETAKPEVHVDGDAALGARVLEMVSIMA
jgi:uncharacterized protein (TIGR03083 family)